MPLQVAAADFDPAELGRAYESKNYKEVEKLAAERLKRDAYDVRARYYLAGALLHLGRPSQAMLQYQACVKTGGQTELARQARQAIVGIETGLRNGSIKPSPDAVAPKKPVVVKKTAAQSKHEAAIEERRAALKKELADAIAVKRAGLNADLERLATDEQVSLEQASFTAGTNNELREKLTKEISTEVAEHREKIYKNFADQELRLHTTYEKLFKELDSRK